MTLHWIARNLPNLGYGEGSHAAGTIVQDEASYDKHFQKHLEVSINLRSTIRFLETCSGATTTELLGFTTSWIGNEKTLIVLNEQFLKFSLG